MAVKGSEGTINLSIFFVTNILTTTEMVVLLICCGLTAALGRKIQLLWLLIYAKKTSCGLLLEVSTGETVRDSLG